MEKQIEKMKKDIHTVLLHNCKYDFCEGVLIGFNEEGIVRELYDEGYRKQVWRDVSDPPKTSGLYIVCTDKGSVFTARYYADCGRFNAPFKKSVLRWTEMPEAPR